MFILLSKSYLIFNQNDLESEASGNNNIAIYNLKLDSTVSEKLEWPNNPVPAKEDQKKNNLATNRCNIICGCFSLSEDYFALCDDNKNLIVFNRDFEPINRFVVKRNCVKIEFNKNEDSILGCDKSGDIYQFEMKKNDGGLEKLLLGHCSMLLDFMLTRDQKFIISCDRDEKIRITNYPNTYNISSYCLGHTEFVQTIKQLDEHTLVSGSGDGKLILWNFLQGKSLFIYQCDQIDEKEQETKNDKSKYAIKSITVDQSNANYLAVSFFNQATVYLFHITRDDNQVITALSLIENLVVEFEPNLIQFDLCHSNFLWLFGAFKDKPIELFELKQNKLSRSFSNVRIVDCLNENVKLAQVFEEERKTNQVSNLFKHYYNNVELYYQRKQLREENNRIKKRHLSD